MRLSRRMPGVNHGGQSHPNARVTLLALTALAQAVMVEVIGRIARAGRPPAHLDDGSAMALTLKDQGGPSLLCREDV